MNKHLKICKLKEKKDKNAEILKQLTNKANFLEIENEQLKDKMKLLEIENVRLKTENEHLKKYNELIDVVKKLKDENNNFIYAKSGLIKNEDENLIFNLFEGFKLVINDEEIEKLKFDNLIYIITRDK